MARIGRGLLALLLPCLLVTLWEVAARQGWTNSRILVPPSAVWATIVEFWEEGQLQADIMASGMRVLCGFALGSSLGLVFGVAAGLSRHFEEMVVPSFHVLRQIPTVAWLPLLVLVAGFGEAFKIIIIATAAFYPTALNTLDGIKNVPLKYFDLARVLGFSKSQLVGRVILPGALHDILTGIRLSVSRAWMLVVAAELTASTVGIGHRMDWGRQLFQLDVVFLGILVTGTVGFALDLVLRLVNRVLIPWQEQRV